MAKRSSALNNQSGQATIEYMLGLCITVMLILTFMYQFSTAFRSYANNYFGEYVACLLETGELPGVSGGNCAASWKAFNLADGKTASGGSALGSTGSSSGNGSGSSSGSKSGSSNSKNAKSKNAKSSSDSSSGSSSKAASNSETGQNGGGGGSEHSSNHRHQRSTSVTNPNPSSSQAGREGLTPLGPVSNSSLRDSSGGSKRTQLSRDFGYAGQQEDENREAGRPTTKAVAKDESGSLKPQKVAEAPARAPASKSTDSDGGFSIGNFIRIILIAGILILIFILFGSQLLAISKGGEK